MKEVEAGQLPPKKADMLKNLQARVSSGKPITEMQAERLEEVGQEYGLC